MNRYALLLAVTFSVSQGALTVVAEPPDLLSAWRSGVVVHPVSSTAGRHSIHAYYTTSPESPDGRYVLFYSSATSEGHQGDLRIVERATGHERVLVTGIETEDAHRAACQQWVRGGKAVAYHNVRDGKWSVNVVDLESGQPRVLVHARQLAFGPGGDWVPVYGCHWNPGEHRDLELVDVNTAAVRTAVTAAAVRQAYPEALAKQFGDRPLSIFFPVVSPDGQRAFFKLATPSGGDFRSSQASTRGGMVCYDLEHQRLLFLRLQMGASRLEPRLADDPRSRPPADRYRPRRRHAEDRRAATLPGHASLHEPRRAALRDRHADGALRRPQGRVGRGRGFHGRRRGKLRHHSSLRQLARRPVLAPLHPHPVFSADGQRIYFNVSSSDWTQLYVAEAGKK